VIGTILPVNVFDYIIQLDKINFLYLTISMSIISIKKLNKDFTVRKRKGLFSVEKNNIKALSNINLDINEPTILTVIGGNGAGKTTFIKLMLGLIAPTTGSVSIMGNDPHKRDKSHLKNIGFVSGQKRVLNQDLSALDSIYVSSLFYGMSSDEIILDFKYLSELFEVSHRVDSPVRSLSLGETIKFEIIASIIHKPKLLFLDEPTIGLDFSAQESIISTLKAFHEENKSTIVLTSHYAKDISALSKQMLILDKGESIFSGSYQDLLEAEKEENSFIIKLKQELKKYA
jgi:ABC-2 type transport system ATP-binding protein